MLLVDWLEKHGVSDANFAELIGKSRIDVFRYKKGRVMPRPDVLARIAEATGGAVQPMDFYAAYQPPEKKPGGTK